MLVFPKIYKLNLLLSTCLSLLLFTSGCKKSSHDEGEFFGSAPTEQPDWFKVSLNDLKDDITEAKQSNKRLMIVYMQRGCPYCNALVEKNMSDPKIKGHIQKNFDVIAYDLWGDIEVTDIDRKTYTMKTFAEKHKIQFTPTVFFYDETGKIILRLNGYLPPDRFTAALEYVSGRKEKGITYSAYMNQKFPGSSEGELMSEEFFMKQPYDLTVKGKRTRPFAVLFEKKKCTECNDLHEKIFTDKVTREIVSQFDIVQLDMNSESEFTDPTGKKTTAKKYAEVLDVKYAPTIVIFNPEGKEIIRSEAFFKTYHTQGMFAYVLYEGYKTQPNFQRYLSARSERIREKGEDVDIFNYESRHKVEVK